MAEMAFEGGRIIRERIARYRIAVRPQGRRHLRRLHR